jgi:uroporphyrinogen-III synthase
VRVLVTRPQADGERTAAKLRERGCEVMVAALLRVELLAADLGEGPWAALVMTSANAAAAVEQHPRRAELLALPVFTVGRHTASAARRMGYGNVTSADGNEHDLARRIAADYRGDAPLLYLAGEDRAGDLAGDLAAAGIAVRTVVAYRAAKAGTLPSDVRAELMADRIEGVLHYSRRSAEAYLDGAKAAGVLEQALAPVHFCLSRQVAEPLIAAGAREVRIAPGTEEAALINLVVS